MELLGDVAERTFAEEVDDLTARAANPIDRCARIYEAENLDLSEMAVLARPGADVGRGFELTGGDPCGSNLDTVDTSLLD